ncbi:helix-turn-helix domain-containing protein [Denitromonas halophila]|uniref:Helix-turn-helix domain-containing protein n=2 Tax=Denitromonas halophila TaxID=1629404 RepID=A0A557QKN3_9RHOO|nr:helix-turn-helix domain-containing protein [Denitromonas halophila]
MTPADAAHFLGVGLSTLWRYARTDPTFPTPARPSTRKTLFPRRDLVAWAESKREASQ